MEDYNNIIAEERKALHSFLSDFVENEISDNVSSFSVRHTNDIKMSPVAGFDIALCDCKKADHINITFSHVESIRFDKPYNSYDCTITVTKGGESVFSLHKMGPDLESDIMDAIRKDVLFVLQK